MQPPSPVISLSPSFTTHSSAKLAEIAARVVDEFRQQSDSEYDDLFGFHHLQAELEFASEQRPPTQQSRQSDDDDDGFEFPSVSRESTGTIPADEIFCNGQIRPVFPLFDRELLFSTGVHQYDNVGTVQRNDPSKPPNNPPTPSSSVRLSLRKLMSEDRDPPSCSSSEADELDGLPAKTYCVWSPKSGAAESSPGRPKKSRSTGTSKRWKFRDLLHRSNSEGKDPFVFLAPSNANTKKDDYKAREEAETAAAGKSAGEAKPKLLTGGSHHEKAAAGGKGRDRRQTSLAYRQDLVGMFANVNGMSRNLHPFQ